MISKTNTTVKLNETQLVLLSAASQRRSQQVVRHETVSEQAYDRAVKWLLKNGLIEAFQGRPGRGRRTVEGDAPYFVINDAGLAAIGATEDPKPAAAEPDVAPPAALEEQTKRGTKRELIIALLSRRDGASLDDLIAATGWLPHTTRAALTGLRHRGLTLDRVKGDDGRAIYRITVGAQGPSLAAEAA